MRKTGLILLTVLGGCTFGPQMPQRTAEPLPPSFSESTGSIVRPAADAQANWWTAFRDPTLDRLLESGFSGNLDIEQARARLAAAEANITASGASGFPALTLGASHNVQRQVGKMREKNGQFQTSGYQVSANWLVDLFGEVRSQIDSAEAGRDAALAGTQVARLALMSGLASSYIDARHQQELGRIASRNLETRRRTLALTRGLEQRGVSSGLDVSRAEEAVRAVEAELPTFDTNMRRAVHRMSTLIGQPAATLLPLIEKDEPQPTPAWRADAGVPADLLRNRPDIRRAEQDFVGSLADIGYAWSQLFPSITLSGSITPSYVRTNAASGNLTTWSFGPTLKLPIFDGGRLRANVAIAIARAEEKQAGWRATVLSAVEDVENALVAYNRETVALATLEARVRAGQRSVDLSNASFREGLSSLFDLLDAQRQLFDAQTALAASRRNLAQQFVSLNVATGRGLPGPGLAKPVGAPQQPSIK